MFYSETVLYKPDGFNPAVFPTNHGAEMIQVGYFSAFAEVKSVEVFSIYPGQ